MEKVFGKSLENVWKPEQTPEEHVFSATICPTLSELCFRADVRRYDHVAVYDDDNIKKKQSQPDILLGLYVTAQCLLRAACAGGCKHNAAREWQAPVAENQPQAVEMDRQSSGYQDSSDNDGEAADFSQGLHKKEMLERKYDDDDDDDCAFSEFSPLNGDQSRSA